MRDASRLQLEHWKATKRQPVPQYMTRRCSLQCWNRGQLLILPFLRGGDGVFNKSISAAICNWNSALVSKSKPKKSLERLRGVLLSHPLQNFIATFSNKSQYSCSFWYFALKRPSKNAHLPCALATFPASLTTQQANLKTKSTVNTLLERNKLNFKW